MDESTGRSAGVLLVNCVQPQTMTSNFYDLYPKMMVGWDCRMSTEKEVVEYVGIPKN
jgi:hypothetical protein